MVSTTVKEPVEVEIMGQRLTLTSDDGRDHIRKVANYVDSEMRRLSDGGRIVSIQLALLAALNIASEYWKLRETQEDMLRRLERISQRVVAQLAR